MSDLVLVLNRSWMPVKMCTVFKAIDKVYRGKAVFVETDYSNYNWEEWVAHSKKDPAKKEYQINGVGFFINKPFVIMITGHYKFKYRVPPPSRKNLFIRDNHTCQFCGRDFTKGELTIDHVLPRAKGGRTIWTNIVACCSACNSKKGNRTPEEAGMILLSKPETPSNSMLFRNAVGKDFRWDQFLNNF